MMLRRRWVLWVAMVVVLGGCGSGGDGPGEGELDQLRQQARDALVRYDKAVLEAGGTPPSWDPYNPPGGLGIESATTTTSGRQLTVTFTGAPNAADQPCGADYTTEAVESATAVVVIVIMHPHAAGEICTAIGASRTATVELAQPLGERAVLDVQQGLPVELTVSG